MSNRGIVCYISSYSYLSDPSFVVVRKRLCGEFNHAWIDCLNGDSRETGMLTPDGQPEPSLFSTEYNREGIRLGTAVGLFAKTGARSQKPSATVNSGERTNEPRSLRASPTKRPSMPSMNRSNLPPRIVSRCGRIKNGSQL